MSKVLSPETREWFLERVQCTRLWEQWTKTPADLQVRSALLESLEKLGLIRSSSIAADTRSLKQQRLKRPL